MFVDPSGEFLGAVVGAVIGGIGGAIGGGISAAVRGEDIRSGMVSGAIGGAIGGAVAGAIADIFIAPGTSIVSAAVIGVAAGAVGGATSSMVSQSMNFYFNNNTLTGFSMSWREVAISSATSALFAGVGSGFGQSQVIFYGGEKMIGVVVGSHFAIGNSVADIANGKIVAIYEGRR